MIRYVPIPAAAIYPGEEGTLFAWFNTVTDRFIGFDGEHVFESWEEFADAWKHDPIYSIERYRALFPAC